MLKFLYQARDANGKQVSATIEAQSAAAARAALEQQGYSEISFFDDEVMARLRTQRPPQDDADPAILAKLETSLMQKPGMWPVLAASLRGSSGFLAVLAVSVVAGLYFGWTWLAVGALVIFTAFLAFFFYNYRPAQYYDRVLRCFSAGDWEGMRAASDLLRARTDTPAILFDLDVREACVEAKRGHLQQAVDKLETWRERMSDPRGMFECRLASVYGAAGDNFTFVALMKSALDLVPDSQPFTIDYALALARFGDLAEAETVAARMNADNLPVQHHAFISIVQGILHLRRDELGEATSRFAKAQDALNAFAANPAIWTTLAFCASYLALALARMGDRERAQAFFRPVATMARAHFDTGLLEAIDREVLHR